MRLVFEPVPSGWEWEVFVLATQLKRSSQKCCYVRRKCRCIQMRARTDYACRLSRRCVRNNGRLLSKLTFEEAQERKFATQFILSLLCSAIISNASQETSCSCSIIYNYLKISEQVTYALRVDINNNLCL